MSIFVMRSRVLREGDRQLLIAREIGTLLALTERDLHIRGDLEVSAHLALDPRIHVRRNIGLSRAAETN
jgi:hypothetical protein